MVFEAMEADVGGVQVQTIDVGWETSERLQMLEAELLATQETLRTTIEEMEASNEEMQATNEEMMASNEELQSANEELQSVNEELNTVNAEFQEKIDILNRMHADLEGLCCTNPVRDSSCESSVVAGLHEQTDTPDLQDQELARLQRSAEAPWLADPLVRSRHDMGGCADRQAWAAARLQRRRHPDLSDDEGAVRHGATANDRVR
jgi:archaellum component FlaC